MDPTLASDPTVILGNAISALRPGAQWSLRGPTLADLEWHDDTQAAPTQSEVDAQIAKDAVPTPVTPRQARLALLQQGLLDKVQAAVTAAGGATQITWEYATMIDRHDDLITTLGTSLGLTSAQIDQLFQLASTL